MEPRAWDLAYQKLFLQESLPSLLRACLVTLCPTGDRVPLHFLQSSSLGWGLGLLLWEEVVLSSFFVPALERQTHELMCSWSGNLSYRRCQQRTTLGRDINAPWSFVCVLFSKHQRGDGDCWCWPLRPKNSGCGACSIYTFNEQSSLVFDRGQLMTVTF